MANNKNKLSQKKNLSSMQVIKTLQILLQDIEKNATIKTKIHFQKVQNTNVYQRNSKV